MVSVSPHQFIRFIPQKDSSNIIPSRGDYQNQQGWFGVWPAWSDPAMSHPVPPALEPTSLFHQYWCFHFHLLLFPVSPPACTLFLLHTHQLPHLLLSKMVIISHPLPWACQTAVMLSTPTKESVCLQLFVEILPGKFHKKDSVISENESHKQEWIWPPRWDLGFTLAAGRLANEMEIPENIIIIPHGLLWGQGKRGWGEGKLNQNWFNSL